MDHFLDIKQLSSSQIQSLLARAFEFKKNKQYPQYSKATVAQLFYEHSTRTRVSFEMAARHLSLSAIHLDLQSSSESKGESITDTVSNLAAMGIEYFVIRHRQDGLPEQLARHLNGRAHIINAGDGTHAHPSQALLDIMTILEHKPQLDKLKIALIGNIMHSRVANSFQSICRTLGVGELVMVAPKLWQPKEVQYGRVSSDLVDGLTGADVVMCFRVQKERLLEGEYIDLDSYKNQYALTQKSFAYAKPDAIIMHPGPINRGIEIDSELANSKQSVILQQVTNGVYARMAILEALILRGCANKL